MRRIPHGSIATATDGGRPADKRSAIESFHGEAGMGPRAKGRHCWFLFESLQNRPLDNLLPATSDLLGNLRVLGTLMQEQPGDGVPDSSIPSIYTYFGQFVDHDVTRLSAPPEMKNIAGPRTEPLTLDEIWMNVRNLRSGSLDLDSVYGSPALLDSRGRMEIGHVTNASEGSGRGRRDLENDLPRTGRSDWHEHDRAARIGDPRNDENLFISQLHVAFLRAHNNLIRDLERRVNRR